MYRKLIILIFIIIYCAFGTIRFEKIATDEMKTIEVEVRGELDDPSVYRLPLGSTFNDLLSIVHPKEDADIDTVSLSERLYNRQLIVIDRKKEERLISINSANIDELMTLPGIGRSTAEKIVEYRKNCGSFLKLEDIMLVKGIGQAKYEKIKKHITL